MYLATGCRGEILTWKCHHCARRMIMSRLPYWDPVHPAFTASEAPDDALSPCGGPLMGRRLHLHRSPTLNRRAAVAGLGMAAALGPHGLARPLLAQDDSGSSAPETDLVLWAWAGATTSTSFTVRAALKTTAPDAQLVVSERDDLADAWMIPPLNDPATEEVLAFSVDDLEPDTDYWYAVSGNGITE